ncbi:hypothetical protein BO94DRAFT_196364 [Aspergillus sclerotioniger CBS 115572]|uniref:Uncharacterized protein n=1 Tax=Aspergillus sclerotioniger CBS 115572 TaxID=1450535 RepID=A0A317VWL4_9EURO|nr:hypothetical protein BO94DRAFT_196364 [Aspergillus sclerotioniger CBS 115572]PWY77298.1 hypothetical protein BO94DRAFT_196364 [Aspergillus sclerotioniger CBS 115572]
MAQSAADLAVETPTDHVDRATGARPNPTDDVSDKRVRAAQTIQVRFFLLSVPSASFDRFLANIPRLPHKTRNPRLGYLCVDLAMDRCRERSRMATVTPPLRPLRRPR